MVNSKCTRIYTIACSPSTATIVVLVSTRLQMRTAERRHCQEGLGIIAGGQEALSPQITNDDEGSREEEDSILVTLKGP